MCIKHTLRAAFRAVSPSSTAPCGSLFHPPLSPDCHSHTSSVSLSFPKCHINRVLYSLAFSGWILLLGNGHFRVIHGPLTCWPTPCVGDNTPRDGGADVSLLIRVSKGFLVVSSLVIIHKHLLRHGQVVVWTCFPVHLEPLRNPGRTVLSLPRSRYVVFRSGRVASCSHQHRRSSCHSRPGCFLFLLFALLLSFVLSCINFYSLSHYILPSFALGLFYSSFSSFWRCEFILLI